MQALTTIPYPNSITPVFAQPVDESGLHDDLRKRGWQLEKIAAYRRLGDEERKGRVIDASTATQGLFGGSGVTEVPWDPLKCSRDVVELLLKRLPEAAHVKAVMLYVHGPMDSTPLRRHAATHIQSRTWRMNMPYALEWEKDAMKHLLVAEFEHRKRMALDAIVPVTYLDGEPHQWSPVDIAEAYTREKRRRPPRNILQWYGA